MTTNNDGSTGHGEGRDAVPAGQPARQGRAVGRQRRSTQTRPAGKTPEAPLVPDDVLPAQASAPTSNTVNRLPDVGRPDRPLTEARQAASSQSSSEGDLPSQGGVVWLIARMWKDLDTERSQNLSRIILAAGVAVALMLALLAVVAYFLASIPGVATMTGALLAGTAGATGAAAGARALRRHRQRRAQRAAPRGGRQGRGQQGRSRGQRRG
ncbi:hypothetical protein ACFYL6_06225 [Micromonospora sp. NPDC007208]|uniref:hypothetical protein n=1 Tax=Micromonospora sp. NPDC007208 TaxID=3364236 RepID=UPI0036AC2F20